MKNTTLANIISNFEKMDNQHFLDWLKENKNWMLERERGQIQNAFDVGFKDSGLSYLGGKKYFSSTYHSNQAE